MNLLLLACRPDATEPDATVSDGPGSQAWGDEDIAVADTTRYQDGYVTSWDSTGTIRDLAGGQFQSDAPGQHIVLNFVGLIERRLSAAGSHPAHQQQHPDRPQGPEVDTMV